MAVDPRSVRAGSQQAGFDHPTEPLLSVRNLRTCVATPTGSKALVDGVSLELARGETLGIVGESGSGKSMMARSIMNLLPPTISVNDPSCVRINGTAVLQLAEKPARRFWGPVVAMVFQDAQLALNPVRTIGAHLMEPLRLHLGMSKADARDRARSLLAEVGIPDPPRRLKQYPHELSGGMCQRVGIALALSCDPQLVIADEPTSALDVTVQRQILELLSTLRERHGMSTILITHDIGVVAHYADRVAVMKDGRIVEQGAVRSILTTCQHPYTRSLIDAVPRLPALDSGRDVSRPVTGAAL